MKKSILYICILLLSIIQIGYGAAITNCTDPISTPGTYTLSGNLIATGNCLSINSNNVILNLNGNSITGDGDSADHGVIIGSSYTNISIIGGDISNFGYGISYNGLVGAKFDTLIENVNFNNNINNDIFMFVSHPSGVKKATIKNCDISGQLYSESFDLITINNTDDNYFNETDFYFRYGENVVFNNVINLKFDSFYAGLVTNLSFPHLTNINGTNLELRTISNKLDFTNLNKIDIYNFSYFSTIKEIEHLNEINMDFYGNLCNADFITTGNKNLFKFQAQNNGDSITNCVDLGMSNLEYNMNGNSITGDNGSSDFGILMGSAYTNVSITNGDISNFGYGISYNGLVGAKFDALIENINFNNNINRDISMYVSHPSGVKKAIIKNCNISGQLYSESFDLLTINNTDDNYFDETNFYFKYGDNVIFNDVINLKFDSFYANTLTNLSFPHLTHINGTNLELRTISNKLDFTNLNKIDIYNFSYFAAIKEMEHLNEIDMNFYGNLCDADFITTGNKNLFKFQAQNDGDSIIKCVDLGMSNLEYDMNGHTITGDNDSSDYGILMGNAYTNVSITNGEIYDFGYGIAYNGLVGAKFDTLIENVNFKNNINRDISMYVSHPSGVKKATIKNCDIPGQLYSESFDLITINNTDNNYFNETDFYFRYGDNIVFNDVNNLKFDSFHANTVTNLTFNNINTITGNSVYLGVISNFSHNNILDIHIYGDLCDSDFVSVNNNIQKTNIFAHNNGSTTTNCINLGINNVEYDFNEHGITGDGDNINDYGLLAQDGYKNFIIKNGFIKNFGQGIRYLTYAADSEDFFIVDNLNLKNIDYDLLFYSYYMGNSRSIEVSNTKFNNTLYAYRFNNITLYGNNFSSQNQIESPSTPTVYAFKNISGSEVGNYWGEFTCLDPSDKYTVISGSYTYTICNNSNHTPIGDQAPLLNLIYSPPIIPDEPTQTPNSNNSENNEKIVLPSGNLFIGIFIIILFLLI